MTRMIGVVGPPDIVDIVAPQCIDDDFVALQLDYTEETEAPAIVQAHVGKVAGWLFTGIGPYTLAEQAGLIDRPAVYLPYTREALQQALIRLLRANKPIDRLSIDTMSQNAVTHCLEGAGIDPTHVRVLPFRADLAPADYAAFHRRAHRGPSGAAYAITCLSSVHEIIRHDLPSVRLRPTRHAIRSTLRHLTLSLQEAARGSAQIALGLVEMGEDSPSLLREVSELGSCIGRRSDGTALVVTTRGSLAEASANFTALPLLDKLAQSSGVVHIGFGLGNTAAEAEHLARRALIRARKTGPAAAVLSRRNDSEVVLAEIAAAPESEPLSVDELARRSGIAPSTLATIRALDLAGTTITPGDLAERLGLQTRSARRILRKLESAGLADRTGEQSNGTRGRPWTLYQVRVP